MVARLPYPSDMSNRSDPTEMRTMERRLPTKNRPQALPWRSRVG